MIRHQIMAEIALRETLKLCPLCEFEVNRGIWGMIPLKPQQETQDSDSNRKSKRRKAKKRISIQLRKECQNAPEDQLQAKQANKR